MVRLDTVLASCMLVLWGLHVGNAELTKTIDGYEYPFELQEDFFENDDLQQNLSDTCYKHWTFYESAFKLGRDWALHMYDASTKLPEGILEGAVTYLGNFDECIAVRDVEYLNGRFHGQHCLAAVNFSISDELHTLPNITLPNITLATCVPSSCSTEDTEAIMLEKVKKGLSHFLLPLPSANVTVHVMQNQCHTAEKPEFKTEDWIVTGVLIIFGFLVTLSTFYDVLTRHSESRINLLLAFSVYTNGKKLFSVARSESRDTFHCIHGIRFLSTCWVVLGHRYRSGEIMPSVNMLTFKQDIYPDWKHLWVTNGSLSVDTFFVLSGLLVTYLFFQRVSKTNKFNILYYYLHRYIRLTPALAAVILLQATLLRYAGSGPLWETYGSLFGEFCQDNWWVTLLYVGNYVEVSRQCMSHAWYLAVDMQLYWLSPIVLIPLWKFTRIGWCLISVFTVLGGFLSFFTSYLIGVRPLYSNFGSKVQTNQTNTQFFGDEIYISTHARYIPYLVGITIGYILFKLQAKGQKIKFSNAITLLLWLVTGGLLLLTLCIVNIFNQPDYKSTLIARPIYNALGRPGWGIGLAFVIFLCVTGHGGVINSFLSWRWFLPLSRLSYSIYLVHLSLQMIQVGSMRTLLYLSDDSLMRLYFSDLVISILLAIVLTLVFEMPFIVLEKELLGGNRKNSSAPSPVQFFSNPDYEQDQEPDQDKPVKFNPTNSQP